MTKWAEKTSNKKKTSKTVAIISTLLLTAVLFGSVESNGLNIDAVDSSWVPGIVSNGADATPTPNTPALPQANTSEPVSVGLCINEFMALNHASVPGPNGTYPDWLELFNAGNESINLSGMYLTDDPTWRNYWRFPNGTFLAPKCFLLIWADRSSDQKALHTGFALNASGGVIGLFASDGATMIDAVKYGIQLKDVAYGRVTDGSETWGSLLVATPGASNVLKSSASLAEELATWIFIIAVLSVCVVVAIKFKSRKEWRKIA